jgi:hypothetical protein
MVVILKKAFQVRQGIRSTTEKGPSRPLSRSSIKSEYTCNLFLSSIQSQTQYVYNFSSSFPTILQLELKQSSVTFHYKAFHRFVDYFPYICSRPCHHENAAAGRESPPAARASLRSSGKSRVSRLQQRWPLLLHCVHSGRYPLQSTCNV